MVRYKFRYLVLVLSFTCAKTNAQSLMPAQYKKVDQVVWVVSNLSNTINGWRKLGFNQFIELDTVYAQSGRTGNSFKVLMAKGNLGGANVTWIQPLEGTSIFSNFHKAFHDGIMSLVYRFEEEDLLKETERLSKLGVETLDKITFHAKGRSIQCTFENTFEKGKYVLGLSSDQTDLDYFTRLSNSNQHQLIIKHYAFAIKRESLSKTSAFWQQLGFAEILPDNLFNRSEKQYHGKESGFELDLAWQENGQLPFEWVMTVKEPTILIEHIAKHGEGLHHLGFISLADGEIQPLNSILEDYRHKGIETAMGASFGEKGMPGSGHFRMMDTDQYGGVILELLWWIRR